MARKTKDIQHEIRETRKEMKQLGIKRVSCFNGGLHGDVYSYNVKMFRLETELIDSKKRCDHEAN